MASASVVKTKLLLGGGVSVGSGVFVSVGVGPTVGVSVGIGVFVAVAVAVAVGGIGVFVGVGLGPGRRCRRWRDVARHIGGEGAARERRGAQTANLQCLAIGCYAGGIVPAAGAWAVGRIAHLQQGLLRQNVGIAGRIVVHRNVECPGSPAGSCAAGEQFVIVGAEHAARERFIEGGIAGGTAVTNQNGRAAVVAAF